MDVDDYTPRETGSQRLGDLESDVAQVTQAVMNEKAGPEILPFEADLLARLESSLQTQEAVVDQLEQTPGGEGTKLARLVFMHEIQRVRYLIQSYFRARLLKIEKYVLNILGDEELKERLSPRELQYANDYFFLTANHLKDNVLKGLPHAFKDLVKQSNTSEDHDMLTMPELDKHVFVHVLADRGTVELDDSGEDTVDFNKGDLYMVPYKPVRDLLRNGWIRLI